MSLTTRELLGRTPLLCEQMPWVPGYGSVCAYVCVCVCVSVSVASRTVFDGLCLCILMLISLLCACRGAWRFCTFLHSPSSLLSLSTGAVGFKEMQVSCLLCCLCCVILTSIIIVCTHVCTPTDHYHRQTEPVNSLNDVLWHSVCIASVQCVPVKQSTE